MSVILKIKLKNLFSNRHYSTKSSLTEANSIPTTISIINDVLNKDSQNREKKPLFKYKNAKNKTPEPNEIYATSPLFAFDRNIIKVPYKVKRSLKRELPKKLLRAIHNCKLPLSSAISV